MPFTVVPLAGLLTLAACGGSPTDFHDMSALAASVKAQVAKASGPGPWGPGLHTVESVTCVASGANNARCVVDMNGVSVALHIMIFANGQNWATVGRL